MAKNFIHQFERAILHIDGDAFFASCEQAKNPALKGKPVVTGKERGIAASMSYEAKAKGVTRAMPIWEIKKICPDVIYLPSDYETYSLLSERFYSIVRRFTPEVEEYGIDECFAEITGQDKPARLSYWQLAEQIQETLRREMGFTFSIGLAPNKVLAKLGSKWKKPYGLTQILPKDIPHYLNVPAEKIWGIGPATANTLRKFGCLTALEFALKSEDFVKHIFARPTHDLWRELNGEFVLPLNQTARISYGSIQKFKTFTPPSRDPNFIFAQLAKNIENACIKLRRYNQATTGALLLLRTQSFDHAAREIFFERPTNLPPHILPTAQKEFYRMARPKTLYRATGVVFFNLVPDFVQPDLFKESDKIEKLGRLYAGADKVAAKYGKHTLFLGISWPAHQFGAHLTARGDAPARKHDLFKGETKRKRLGIPMLGGVVN